MSHVAVTRDLHILHIHLTRPKKYNALSVEMYEVIAEALYDLNNDPALRVAVLSADGQHFTAGVELDKWAEIFGGERGWPLPEKGIDPFGMRGDTHKKPIIAAVQGYCFTWGVEVLLNTEIRVAASDTQFQMLEVQRGIYPCGGATIRLPRDIGWSNAQRYLLTGERWTAQQAQAWGMVQEITEPGAQIERALEIAKTIANAAPLAVQASLASSRYSLEHDVSECTGQIFESFAKIMKTKDAAEGVQSFIERRQAQFIGE